MPPKISIQQTPRLIHSCIYVLMRSSSLEIKKRRHGNGTYAWYGNEHPNTPAFLLFVLFLKIKTTKLHFPTPIHSGPYGHAYSASLKQSMMVSQKSPLLLWISTHLGGTHVFLAINSNAFSWESQSENQQMKIFISFFYADMCKKIKVGWPHFSWVLILRCTFHVYRANEALKRHFFANRHLHSEMEGAWQFDICD